MLQTISDIDECEASPCQNSATCEDEVNSFRCSCSPGYSGERCETGDMSYWWQLIKAIDFLFLANRWTCLEAVDWWFFAIVFLVLVLRVQNIFSEMGNGMKSDVHLAHYENISNDYLCLLNIVIRSNYPLSVLTERKKSHTNSYSQHKRDS